MKRRGKKSKFLPHPWECERCCGERIIRHYDREPDTWEEAQVNDRLLGLPLRVKNAVLREYGSLLRVGDDRQ
jgi:hypothetical protein